jgi:dihydrofolate synthase/folylpolyglutamate synthase
VNAATALSALASAPESIRIEPEIAAASLSRVELPGRYQQRGKYVFDVAHNPAGAAVLAETIRAVAPPRPRVAVVSVLDDKDWLGMLEVLSHAVDHIILTTAPTSPTDRTWDPAAAIRAAEERGWPCVLEADFGHALDRAEREGRTVIVTGSFHTVGDAFTRLHVSPFA